MASGPKESGPEGRFRETTIQDLYEREAEDAAARMYFI